MELIYSVQKLVLYPRILFSRSRAFLPTEEENELELPASAATGEAAQYRIPVEGKSIAVTILLILTMTRTKKRTGGRHAEVRLRSRCVPSITEPRRFAVLRHGVKHHTERHETLQRSDPTLVEEM